MNDKEKDKAREFLYKFTSLLKKYKYKFEIDYDTLDKYGGVSIEGIHLIDENRNTIYKIYSETISVDSIREGIWND